MSSVSAWLENQRLELGRTIESKHPSLPLGFIDGEADSNIHLTYLLGNYLARTVRHRRYISEPNKTKIPEVVETFILLRKQTNIGHMLESAQCCWRSRKGRSEWWEVGSVGTFLSRRDQGGSP